MRAIQVDSGTLETMVPLGISVKYGTSGPGPGSNVQTFRPSDFKGLRSRPFHLLVTYNCDRFLR